MKLIRLDKYLGEMGEGSRSQIKEAAKKGRIWVNGVPEKSTDLKINPDSDQIMLDGRIITYAEYEYYMLNKPQGVVSATEDRKYKTVVSLITSRLRSDLFPVGRLDIDTEGLLLITNDGALAHRLLSPNNHVDKTYYAKAEGRLPEHAAEFFAEGITLSGGVKTRPANLIIISKTDVDAEILLTIHEGKYHQVKRMLEAVGCNVVYLKRLTMGHLKLDDRLKPGDYRPLTKEEILLLSRDMKDKDD